jgi:preprotein translocase SecE subunit
MEGESNLYVERAKKIRIASYFRQVQQEFKRITWTTKADLISMTKIMLGATLIGGFSIYFADLVVQSVLQGMMNAIRWIIA